MNALRDSDERTHLENADSTAAVCTTQTIHQNCNPSIHFLSPQAQPSVHSTNCSQSARVVSENEHAPPHLTHLHSQGYHGGAGGVEWLTVVSPAQLPEHLAALHELPKVTLS